MDKPVFSREVRGLDPLAVRLGYQLWENRALAAAATQIDIARQMLSDLAQQSGIEKSPLAISGEAHRITELLRRYRQKGWYNMPAEFRRPTAPAGHEQGSGPFSRPTRTLDPLAVLLGNRLWELARAGGPVPSQVDVARGVVRQSMSIDEAQQADPGEIDRGSYRLVDLLKAYRLKGWYRMPRVFRKPKMR